MFRLRHHEAIPDPTYASMSVQDLISTLNVSDQRSSSEDQKNSSTFTDDSTEELDMVSLILNLLKFFKCQRRL